MALHGLTSEDIAILPPEALGSFGVHPGNHDMLHPDAETLAWVEDFRRQLQAQSIIDTAAGMTAEEFQDVLLKTLEIARGN